MKKVILCAGALLFGSFAFAQVGGAPTASTPVTNLSIDPDANVGESVQNGNAHKIRVRQAGSRQTVYTEQDNGSTATGGNLGIVLQTGAVSTASGVENAAELRQSGSVNQSLTIQQGDLNNAVTLQGQNDDASTGNKARIQQGNNDQAEGNFAAIEQNGATNTAQTLQRWDNNDAWTRQTGTDNKSMINQAAEPDDSDGHSAMNEQIGLRNESFIDQSGAGARNVATARQLGDDNQVKQTQTTTATEGMIGNRADVKQGIPASDDPLISTLRSDLSAVTIGLSGSQGDSDGARAKQVQNGKEQEAAIRQFGGSVDGSNYAEQNQISGWGNDAVIWQGHFTLGDPDNYARQDQAGDNNKASIAQEGSGNKALQTQLNGHRNDALTYQSGQGNLSNTHQRGNDNVGNAFQVGTSNRALIVQRGGQSYLANQNGTGNQVDIYQGLPSDDFSNMIECDFDDPMNLDMDYELPGLDIPNICPDC